MRRDPIFQTLSDIRPGGPVVNPAEDSPRIESQDRAERIWEAAYEVRRALFARFEEVAGTPADMLPEADQTDLLLAAFCGRMRFLARYMSPEVEATIAAFRSLVPVVQFNAMEALSSRAISISPDDVREMLVRLSAGKITPEEAVAEGRKFARLAGVEYPEEMPPADAAAILVDRIDAARRQGMILTEIAEATEARVYLSPVNQCVYKAIPFRREMVQVKPILGAEPICADHSHGAFLADQNGRMPLFDRARLLAQVSGVCRTELVAISAAGAAIYKQPYLGEVEPTEEAIKEWAGAFGHEALPEQGLCDGQDPIEGDMNRIPIVTGSPHGGSYVIGLDLNPRNCRVWNGQCVPFDPVLRELTPLEIAGHPQIGAAVDSIAKRRCRRADCPDI